jgi:pimeloyl-ACP methyl ester carboxylesterase
MKRASINKTGKDRKILPWLLAGTAVLPVAALLGPFLIPVRPLKNTYPPQALADPDSHFVELNGLKVHLKTMGNGEPLFVLLHGFMSSLYSWHSVMEPLSRIGRTIAYDRPAFGLTERPLKWKGQNPYSPEAQQVILDDLLDYYKIQKAILVGSSAGGGIAVQYAINHPERITALILVDAAIYKGGGSPGLLRPLLATPQMRRLGPLFIRQFIRAGVRPLELAWHKPSNVDPKILDFYKKPLMADNWDQALWEFTIAQHDLALGVRLNECNFPVLVISGDNDRIVPTADSIRLSKELQNASITIIPDAGHLPHEEQPAVFMDAVQKFLNTLPEFENKEI